MGRKKIYGVFFKEDMAKKTKKKSNTLPVIFVGGVCIGLLLAFVIKNPFKKEAAPSPTPNVAFSDMEQDRLAKLGQLEQSRYQYYQALSENFEENDTFGLLLSFQEEDIRRLENIFAKYNKELPKAEEENLELGESLEDLCGKALDYEKQNSQKIEQEMLSDEESPISTEIERSLNTINNIYIPALEDCSGSN